MIGGSFAKAIAKNFPKTKITAIEKNSEDLKKALADGIISKGEEKNQTSLQEADLVIFTLYPKQLKTFILNHQKEFKKGALLTDVTGVKESIMKEIIPILPKENEFIFGHPMAGRESQGYAFSSGTIFNQANYLLVISNTYQEKTALHFEKFLTQVGFKTLTWLTPKKHDAAIAYTSQLPHVLAVSLINIAENPQAIATFTGDSFKELTRIAKINGPLWQELFFNNKQELLKNITTFENELDKLKLALAKEDETTLLEIFAKAKEKREQFEENIKK